VTAEHVDDTPLQRAAATYAANGVAIFPVTPRGKLPLLPRCPDSAGLSGDALYEHAHECEHDGHGFWDATTDPDTIKRWWAAHPEANIGIALGVNRIFAVDVDGPAGRAALDELELIYDKLPATYTVKTGRIEGHGRHLLYRQPADREVRNCKLGPKLEIRGAGGYVVAPPSIHESGRAYLAEGSWAQITDPPPWLVELAVRSASKPTDAAGGVPTLVRPAPAPGSAQDRAQARLAGLAGKVAMADAGPDGKGADRNNMLNWAAYQAGRIIGAGALDEADARHQLQMAAQRAGLGQRETTLTISSGIAAGRQDPDHDTTAPPQHPPSPGVAPVTLPDPTAPPSPLVAAALTKIRPGGTFILDAPTDIEPVWGHHAEVAWAAGEPCILTGPTGVGKTTVAHQLVERLVRITGTPVLGLPVRQAKKVLYLACDRPRQIQRAFARRYDEEHRELLDAHLSVHDGYLPAMVDQSPTLLAELVVAVEADVVIVDSLKDVATELEKGPNAIAINQALQLACQAGADVLVLHHQRKAQSDNKRPKAIDDLYGNTLIPSGAGSVLLLWGTPGDLAVELHHLKRPAEEIGPLRLVHDHTLGVTTVDEEGRIDLLDLAVRLRGVTVARAAEVLFATDKPTRNETEKARYQLGRLVAAGMLTRHDEATPGGGKPTTVYRPVAPPVTTIGDADVPM
jgi:adenylate kinase